MLCVSMKFRSNFVYKFCAQQGFEEHSPASTYVISRKILWLFTKIQPSHLVQLIYIVLKNVPDELYLLKILFQYNTCSISSQNMPCTNEPPGLPQLLRISSSAVFF